MENYIGKICPSCNAEIKEGDSVKVCPDCNVAYHEACWEANNGCACKTASAPEEAVETTPAEACGNCGTALSADQDFCPNCGTAKNAPKKNLCGKCGAELQEGQEFCPACGQKAGLAIDADVNTAINQFNEGVQKQNEQKNKKPLIIGAIVVAVLLLILIFKGPSVDEVILSEESLDLRVDESTTVTCTIEPAESADAKVKWKSSNTSVANVNNDGKIVATGEGSCTITATAGGKSDSVTVTVKAGPDFQELYNKYCKSTWADYGSDGSYLSVDTNPYDWDDDGLAYPAAYTAISKINTELGLPSSLLKDMGQTTGADGRQSETFGGITVTWKYHPDKGLEVSYKLN